MNAIDQEQKGDEGSVYGATDMILCAHPNCYEMFKEKGHKKYHLPECKDAHHKMERIAGQKVLNRGTMRAATMENSEDRLIPIAKIMADGKEYTPMQIDDLLRELSPPIYCYHITTAIQELKKNGLEISKRHIKKQTYAYRLVGGQTQLLKIVS